jgi:hypothetical protein
MFAFCITDPSNLIQNNRQKSIDLNQQMMASPERIALEETKLSNHNF